MGDTARRRPPQVGYPVVVAVRVGAALGLLATALVLAVAGGSGDGPVPGASQLIDGVAAGAALGAVGVLVARQRETRRR